MTRKTLVALAVLGALSAGTALAASQAPVAGAETTPRVKLDSNGDGSVDREEAAAHPRLAAKFDELDKNKDGRISKEEMPVRSHRGDGKRGHGKSGHSPDRDVAQLDTDKDGRISRAESVAGGAKATERFDRMDVNKDGFIDQIDREQLSRQRAEAWFAAADTDKDGKLSRAEVDAAKGKRSERGPRPETATPGD